MLSQYSGNETLGAFLPGLKKIVKRVGKVTSPFTSKIAKSFLPSSLVDSAAAFDPVKKGLAQAKKSATDLLKPPPAPKTTVKPKAAISPAIIGVGIAAVAALFLIGKRR